MFPRFSQISDFFKDTYAMVRAHEVRQQRLTLWYDREPHLSSGARTDRVGVFRIFAKDRLRSMP